MSLNIEEIRKDFPILEREVYKHPLVYLDNGATTQKPRCVVEAMVDEYYNVNANVHRGVHFLSQKATDLHEQSRETVRRFINAKSTNEIIFTRGTTESINLLAFCFGEACLHEGDEVVVSTMEHHSNIVPWQMVCQRKGAHLRVIPMLDDYTLDIDAFKALLNERTRIVCCAHVSNVLGTINPVRDIIRISHERNIPVLIDGAQSTPHFAVDVQDLDCDFFAFSGHKIYGPTGVGVLYGKEEWLDRLPPYQGGGEMIKSVSFEHTTYNELPYKLEAGTPDYVATHGLAVALDYVSGIGMDNIYAHEQDLTRYALEQMTQIEDMKIFGTQTHQDAVISFQVGKIHHLDLGTLLDRLGIAIRTGHHCAEPLMRRLGIDGTSRASFGLYNTRQEVDALVAGIKRIRTMFCILLTMVLMILPADAFAKGKWKEVSFNKEQYKRAYAVYDSTFSISGVEGDKVLALADSIYDVGVAQDNYAVQLVTYMMKAKVYKNRGSIDKTLDLWRKYMDQAKHNGNIDFYFSGYYHYLYHLADVDESGACAAAKRMMTEAKLAETDKGLMYAYYVLGDIYLYNRDNPEAAAEQYAATIRLAKKVKMADQQLFDMIQEYAKALTVSGKYNEAKAAFDEARSMKVFNDEYNRFAWDVSYLELCRYTGTIEEYNELYTKRFLTPEINSMFDENTQLYYKGSWHLKNKRYNEALEIGKHLEGETGKSLMMQAYEGMGLYDKALKLQREITDEKQLHRMKMEQSDMAAMEAELRTDEITLEAQRERATKRIYLASFVVIALAFLLILVLVLLYHRAKAAKTLKRANDLKNDFIHNVTHELRTPINHIHGFSSVLNDDIKNLDDATLKNVTSTICSSSMMLTGIIDDMLQLSVLSSSQDAPAIEDVDPQKVISIAIDQMSYAKKAVPLKTEVEVPFGFTFRSNADMVQYALRMLISNAIKFTKEGEIVISAALGNGNVVFTVADTGSGVPKGKEEEIFERFVKLDSFIPGTGIGLTICRMLCQRLGGSVVLDRTYTTKGSRFIITLPLNS